MRVAENGQEFGQDTLEPLLWDETNFLLQQPMYARTLTLLDDFLRTNAERLITDPVKMDRFFTQTDMS